MFSLINDEMSSKSASEANAQKIKVIFTLYVTFNVFFDEKCTVKVQFDVCVR